MPFRKIISMIKNKKISKPFAIFYVAIIFLVTFSIAVLPFSFARLLTATVLVMLGFVTPFASVKVAWWLYTLGGKCPLPKEHKWLLSNTNRQNKEGYMGFVTRISNIMIPLAVATTMFLIYSENNSVVLILIKILCLIGVFGVSLTLGTATRKRQLLKSLMK